MNADSLKKCVLFFHVICWTATVTVISYWIYIYGLNQDLSVVNYKKYYQSKDDVFPVLSLCLNNPFSEENVGLKSAAFNKTSYLKFLEGSYFVPEMLDINYENMSIDMSEYVVKYWVEWRNGSSETHSVKNGKRELFTLSYAGFRRTTFYNCYAMQVPPNKQIQAFAVLLKSNIYPSGIRPVYFGMMTLLHYPNQLLRSMKTVKYVWPKRETNVTYDMKFYITGMEVMKRRSKGGEHCNMDWENDDDSLIVKHTNTVGCRAPYQNPSSNITKCSTKDQMKEVLFKLRADDYGTIPPCKSMEKIDYKYEEADLTGTSYSGTGHFWFSIYLFNPQFKEIVQTR